MDSTAVSHADETNVYSAAVSHADHSIIDKGNNSVIASWFQSITTDSDSHPGPMCMENNPSDESIVDSAAVSHADHSIIDKGNNPASWFQSITTHPGPMCPICKENNPVIASLFESIAATDSDSHPGPMCMESNPVIASDSHPGGPMCMENNPVIASWFQSITTDSHTGPMCMENNPIAVSLPDPIAVSLPDPMDKGNNSSESKMDKGTKSSQSNMDESVDKGTKSSESNMDESVDKGTKFSYSNMDKSLYKGTKSSGSKVSINSISDEIAFSILSKLSIKSLKRFESVRKSWSILFENSDFMTMYSNHFISRHGSEDDYHTFVLTNHNDRGSGSCQSAISLLDNRVKVEINLPSPLQCYEGLVSILGSTSVNGIFCLWQNYDPDDVQYVLWNPATDEFRVIPASPTTTVKVILSSLSSHWPEEFMVIPSSHSSPEEFKVIHSSCPPGSGPKFMVIPSIPDTDDTDEFMNSPSSPDTATKVFLKSPSPDFRVFHGFGYDQLKDDYKVIQCVSFDFDVLPSKTFLEIYSLKSNSWRLFDMDNVLSHNLCYPWPFSGHEVYVDGAYHWLVSKSILYQPEPEISLLSFDLSSEMFLTTPIGKSYTRQHLAVLNGSIALISSYVDDVVFHISILGELGVSESWIKLYTYGAFPSIQWPPIGFGKMGYIYFKKRDYELAYVDLSTKTTEEIGISGGGECYVNIGLYKESRLSIGGSSN